MICPEAIGLIKHFEGLGDGNLIVPGLHPYVCPAGVWSVGYGTTYGLDGNRITGETDAISKRTAEGLLFRDVNKFERAVDRLVKVQIHELQRGSLTSFAYNLGAGSLQASTLLRRINGFEWDDVPRQFLRWVMAGGVPLLGLKKRRKAEVDLWVEGAKKIRQTRK
jgi:lysozyme